MIQSLLLVIGLIVFVSGLISNPFPEFHMMFVIVPALLFLYALVLGKVGFEVSRANIKYKKAGYIFGVLCIITQPGGVLLGPISLVFQFKGKAHYVPA